MASEAPANFSCEEVLLPETNGENAGNENTEEEYLIENDPMSEDVDDASQQDDNATGEDEDGCSTEVEEKISSVVEPPAIKEVNNIKTKSESKPTTLPKKRKDTSTLIDTSPPATEKINDEPASTSRAAATKMENQVDEAQCRVCTTKDDLISLFKEVERQTIADMLMTICPTVSIAPKDFMPQFICNPCLDNVTIAVQLKTQCETTERELRKKLSRSKNKVRRPMGYVTIDATIDSDPPSEEEEQNDDVEFKVSDEVSASGDDDSEDSDFSGRRRISRGGANNVGTGRRGRPRQAVAITTTTSTRGRKSTNNIKRESRSIEVSSGDESSGGGGNVKRKKRKHANVTAAATPTEYPCDECEQVFPRKLSLVLHKKAHSSDRAIINCEYCNRQFKIQGAYRTHLQKHKEEQQGHPCDKCDEVYASKADLKRHLAEDHHEPGMVYTCNKCNRTFVSTSRLDKHISRCPGVNLKPKRGEFEGYAVGQDLFKSVAPLTTTYWSDSFSD